MRYRLPLIAVTILLSIAGCSGSSESDESRQTTSGGAGGAQSGSGGSNTGGSLGGNGLPADCFGPCCQLPQQGGSCSATDEGQSCPTSTLCEGGLVLDQRLACENGTWQLQGETCPGPGDVTAAGCPGSQPTNGDTCSMADGSAGCMYRLECAPKACDAGSTSSASDGSSGSAVSGTGCASVSGKVAFATCTDGHWSTEPLGTCP